MISTTESVNTDRHSEKSDIFFVETNRFIRRHKFRRFPKKNVNGLFLKSGYQIGKWSQEEHNLFLQACYLHGNNWLKIQEEIKTRTPAQIRSHAQKYIIRLCKKYSIKLKSKKFKKHCPMHLISLQKSADGLGKEIDLYEKKLLDIFNYYHREYRPFLVEKKHKDHNFDQCVKDHYNEGITRRLNNKIFYVKKIRKSCGYACQNKKMLDSYVMLMKESKSFFSTLAAVSYELEYCKTFVLNFANPGLLGLAHSQLLNDFIKDMDGTFRHKNENNNQISIEQAPAI